MNKTKPVCSRCQGDPLSEHNIYCSENKHYHNWERVGYEVFQGQMAVFYICEGCQKYRGKTFNPL
jgi:hypothetical protein